MSITVGVIIKSHKQLHALTCLAGASNNNQLLNPCPIVSVFFRVDPLYAFFIQWSPELYGEEDEMADPSSRGFVVIEDDDVEEELEVIDDYFEAKNYSRGRRISLSKGWEVREEAVLLVSCGKKFTISINS